jgi:hypothetical protein
LHADTKTSAAHRKARPAERAAEARANRKVGAISREEAAVHLGVGYSTLEKMAARGGGGRSASAWEASSAIPLTS